MCKIVTRACISSSWRGEKTEPAYFKALEERNLVPRHRVKLHVFSPDANASAPTYLIGSA